MKKFWNWVHNEEADENILNIEGTIAEDSWYDDETTPKIFKSELQKYKGKPITVSITSYGGDVFAGAQIYTMLKEHNADVTVKIPAYAMSAASVIAMAGSKVMMSPVATLMIHNPWTIAIGDERNMQQAIDALSEIKQTIINAYMLKTGKSKEELSQLMDDETYMNAYKAVELGFADEVMFIDEEKADGKNALAYSPKLVFNCLVSKIKDTIGTAENEEIQNRILLEKVRFLDND